jgi:hypothetical protein
LASVDNEAFFMNELHNIQRRGNEIKAECPFKNLHESQTDNNPSLTVNLAKGVYYCNSCHTKGNIHTLYMQLYNVSKEDAWFALGDALSIERPEGAKPARPDIDVGLVSEYHQNLMTQTGPIRRMLAERRGLTDESLKHFQLGWDGERITIPVYDEFNTLVNFRRYKWNSNDDMWKVLNYVDEYENSYGEVRIYGLENILDTSIQEIVWSEGELDRISAEQRGFHAACPTSGAGTWRPEWARLLKGKKCVYLAQDNDEAGRSATKRLCEKMYQVVNVRVIQWPEDFLAKGDITDFFTKYGGTTETFQKLLDESIVYTNSLVQQRVADETDAVDVDLAGSSNSRYYGKRVSIPVMISGKDSTPFICPCKVKVSCGEAADGDNKKCYGCELATNGGELEHTFTAADACLMKMVKCTDKQQEVAIKEALGINLRCSQCTVAILEQMNIEELRLIPKAETEVGSTKEHEYVVRTGYSISDNLKTNNRYTLVGYAQADPATQYSMCMFDKAYPEKDMISDFEMTEDTFEQLKVFQPAKGQRIVDKFNEIHNDLEHNVTFIWERRDVAFAVDLTYHTVLNFYFQGQLIKKGWGDLLIIGDSGQAKTTLVERLMQHYRAGEMLSGEASRRTGLVYNIQQNNKRWFLVWGALPLNDGGLVTIDELSGVDEDDLAKMSDVRSSGIARATGVVTAETNARTRTIYISNPRNGRPLNTETYGVMSVLKLFGKTEDVRRLDLAMSVASGDIDATLINRDTRTMQPVKHTFTTDLCHQRVLWAWSRRPENVQIQDEATTEILQKATEMGRKYSAKVPIVEAADQRLKIARLATSCACCMFSTTDGENVIVTKEHVDFVVDFMNKLYCTKSMGYDKMSEQEDISSDTSDDNIVKLRKQFLTLPITDFNEMADVLYQLPYFNRNTLEDYTGLSRDDLKMLLKFMTNQHLVDKVHGDYRRLPLGTKLFENLTSRTIKKPEIDAARKEMYGDVDY